MRDRDHPSRLCASPDRKDLLEELVEDLALLGSGLFGSRPFSFIVGCKCCITVLDGRLSVTLVLGLAEDGRDDVIVLGEDLAFLAGMLGDEVEGFALSCSMVALSTDTTIGSSAADSPAAGHVISPPPQVIVVSALDPDVILNTINDQPPVGRAYG